MLENKINCLREELKQAIYDVFIVYDKVGYISPGMILSDSFLEFSRIINNNDNFKYLKIITNTDEILADMYTDYPLPYSVSANHTYTKDSITQLYKHFF